MDKKKSIKYVDFGTQDGDGSCRLWLSEKHPVFDDHGDAVAILANFFELPHEGYYKLYQQLIDLGNLSEAELNQRPVNRHQLYKISIRQEQCLFYLCRGYTTKAIANQLKLSEHTIVSYINELKSKVGVSTKSELIEKAIKDGFLHYIPFHMLKGEKIFLL